MVYGYITFIESPSLLQKDLSMWNEVNNIPVIEYFIFSGFIYYFILHLYSLSKTFTLAHTENSN